MSTEKESLLTENPWLDLVEKIKNNAYTPLTSNVHPKDKKHVDEFNIKAKEEHKYKLGILPEPFWGNVLDAKIVILTLNPGYVFEQNHEAYEKLSPTNKKEFVKDQCNYLSLQSKQFIPENEDRNNISDRYWEKKTKELYKEFKGANSKIALIQYLAYTSCEYKDMPKKIIKKLKEKEGDFLYTQQFAVRLVKYLMEQNRVIIIARSEKLWYNMVEGLETYKNLIILNSYGNTVITKGNCTKSKKWHLIEEALKE